MARNGVPAWLVVLVATAVLATTALSVVPPTPYTWDNFLADQEAKQNTVNALDTTVTTEAAPPRGWTIVVDKNGKYKTVGAAIKSIPKSNRRRVTVFVKDGVYKEKLLIDKDYVYLKCESKKVVLTYGDTAGRAGGTSKSASTAIEANGFIASDCTFANSAPAPPGGSVGKQAVALRIQGDQGAFYRCSFYGAQDTLYDKQGRHYFRSCYIVGSIDFIFGDGQSIYHYCNLRSIAQGTSGSFTAQKRETNSPTGFVFLNCYMSGTGTIYLGRAWGTHSRVVFIGCNITNKILPIGWMDWGDKARQKTVFYAEYGCRGIGANRRGRAPWSRVLTASQARLFSNLNYINGPKWLTGPL